MGTLRIQRPGMLTTVQDLGRPGHSAIGIPTGGAADPLSLRIGNRLLGNRDSTAALEMTMLGGTFLFDDAATVCITGGACTCALDSRPLPPLAVIRVPAGSTLECGPITRGVRTYLCIAGGIDVPNILGSRSTHIAAAFGGHHGRALRIGDLLQTHDGAPSNPLRSPDAIEQLMSPPTLLRAVPCGRPDDGFWSASHTISLQSNRTGVRLHRLESPPAASTGRMISEGMPPGAIQVPPGGEAIILGPDHPTTGGYPVIGCIASVDLHLIGQLRPGDAVRFQPISQREALNAHRERERTLDQLLPPIA